MARRPLIPSRFRRDLEPFNWLHHEVDQLFDNFWQDSNLWPTVSRKDFLPMGFNADVYETKDDFTIAAELPGLEEDEINVEFNNNILTISGEKKIDHEEKNKNFYRFERSSGSFSRSIQIPVAVDEDHIQAKFKNGVLTITLPKSVEAMRKTKQIEIQKS